MAGTKIAASKAEKVSKKIDEKPVKKERKPRAPTAYNNFIKHFYAEFAVPDGEEKPKPKEMIAMAAAEWKKLTDDEKAEYKTPVSSDTEEAKEEPKKKEEKKSKKKEAKVIECAEEEAPKKEKKEAKVTECAEEEAEEATDKEEAPKKEKKSKKSKKSKKEGLVTTSESEKEDI